VRQLLTEAMIVSVVGGVVGVVSAYIAVPWLVGLFPDMLPRVEDIGVNERVLVFALVVTFLAGVVVGIAPVFHSARANIADALRQGGRRALGDAGLRRVLVVSEVTLAMTLLVVSVLLVKGFWRVQTMDYGWEKDNVLTFRISLPEAAYETGETVVGFYGEVVSRLASNPAALAVSGSTLPPLQGNTNTFFAIPGRETPSIQQRPLTEFRFVFPEYFQTMDVPVLRGRSLGDQDRPTTPPVVVVNEILADRHWPGENPVGRQMRFWGETREIVGVVGNTMDVRHYAEPMVFMSAFQYPTRDMSLLIRTAGEPSSMVEVARATVAALDPDLPIYDVQTMEEAITERWGGETSIAKIMGCLAVVALLLAVAGVYGVLSYLVSQRIREMGIRMALGAERVTVLRMVLRQGAVLTATGVAVGILLASFVTRSLSFFLLGVSPFDLPMFGAVALALFVAGVAAAYLPARRATRADPLDALRAE
jgi:putative ABC transport system permease protein